MQKIGEKPQIPEGMEKSLKTRTDPIHAPALSPETAEFGPRNVGDVHRNLGAWFLPGVTMMYRSIPVLVCLLVFLARPIRAAVGDENPTPIEALTMQHVHDELKTPFNYWVVLAGETCDELVDCAIDPATSLDATVPPPVADGQPAGAAFKARPFALQYVRLLDGPFKTAMDRDARYMLEIDPDRLLHNFRRNANLPSTAQPLGNWESPGSGLRGHLTGHYLSACALMYGSTGDKRFKERATLLVRELAKCQSALGNSGYLSAFPETVFDELEAGKRPWAPYYTLHKILAGLLDAHTLCGNAEALDVAKKMGDWVVWRIGRLSDEHLALTLDVEHGGINESMANLHALTADPRFLAAARRLCHKKVFDLLAAHQDKLSGLHANTQIPKIIGAARLYEITGEERYRDVAGFFWDRVVNHHSYVIGGNSDHEGFGPPDKLNLRVSPFTAESCNTYNMLKLTRQLFAWNPQATQADYYERALYNHILASQDPLTGRMAYHIPVYGAWFMPYNTPNDSCWCCTGSGFENHAKYGDSIYWQSSDGLFVNLFIPSELHWRDKSVTLRQETRYPEEETSRFELRCEQPTAFALHLRYPGWAERGMEIKVNGERFQHDAKPGSFVSISRTWKTGDRIEIKLPMDLRLEPMPDNPTRAAICYGPVVLAGELGTGGITPPMPYAVKQSDFFNELSPPMPVLLAGKRPVRDWLERVPGEALTFRTKGVGQPNDVTLVAFYKLLPQRYSLYWDIHTAEQWNEHQEKEKRRAEHLKRLDARTVDSAGIGDSKAEQAHHVKGGETTVGSFFNRPYRVAKNGGWFSFELKIPKDQPVKILCTYWGGDAGPRHFDILADGTRIGTEKLNMNSPGAFFDVEYPLPPELHSGKSSLIVKFQALPKQIAGGVYDLRVVRPTNE